MNTARCWYLTLMIPTWLQMKLKPQLIVKWAGIINSKHLAKAHLQPQPQLRKNLFSSLVHKTLTPTCLSTWEQHQESHLSFGSQMNLKDVKISSSVLAYKTMVLMTRWPTISTLSSGPSTCLSLIVSLAKALVSMAWNRVLNSCSRLCSSNKMNYQKLNLNFTNQPLKMRTISLKQK